ncbi:hypothetical protein OAK75_10820 [Bacteriovoracales bacterium]|nr:hypothetical protein [Bacteriovoracales bacterium]
MDKAIRIDGIYDNETLKTARSLGIGLFNFDFRPKSFNFLQQHYFLNMLSEGVFSSENFFMHFANEKDFVIFKMLEDIKETLSSPGLLDQFNLEFSDECESFYYDQFETPFYWHFRLGASIEEVLKTYQLRGIVWSLPLLEDINQGEGLETFFTRFLEGYGENIRRMGLKMVLRVGSSIDLIPALFQILPFDFISLPIDSSLELSYRSVNFDHLRREIQYFDSMIS